MPDMDKLIDLHNKARNKSWSSYFGFTVNPLTKNEKLMEYAQNHAKWMAENSRMRHSSMRNIMNLGFNRVGENIAWGQKTEESVMNAWLWSPGHRRNIMSSSYTDIGCGAFLDSKGRIYWCVCFGKPKSPQGDKYEKIIIISDFSNNILG